MNEQAHVGTPKLEDGLRAARRALEAENDDCGAERLWHSLADSLSLSADPFIGEVRILIREGQWNAGRRLIAFVLGRYGESAGLSVLRVELAIAQSDWADAVERADGLRQSHPDIAEGYILKVRAARLAGRLEEADAAGQEGLTLFPGNLWLLIEHTETALYRHDVDAVARAEQLRLLHPNIAEGFSLGMRAQRREGRLEEAQALGEHGAARFPNDAGVAIESIETALEKRHWLIAAARAAQLRQTHPDANHGYVLGTRALIAAARFEEAEAIITEAYARFPHDLGVLREWGWSATHRRDWREARRRWELINGLHPNVSEFQSGLGETRLLASFANIDEGQLVHASPPRGMRPTSDSIAVAAGNKALSVGIEADPGSISGPDWNEDLPPISEIVRAFESLGGTLFGCELGLVQREFGTEPLGLLRWTELGPDDLAAVLEAGFAGVGLPENTEIVVPPASEPGAEYATLDRRFGMRMHTFVRRVDVAPEDMLDRVCRRLRFLKEKLLSDLQDGERMFVYKMIERNLTYSEIERIRAGVQRYGNGVFFVVQYEDEEHPNGFVEWRKNNLMVGYIDRFAKTPAGDWIGVPIDSWTLLLLNAFRNWRSPRGDIK